MESSPDVIVLGAGVCGASLAHALGSDGRRVLLIERDLSEPDTFRGELLQPGGLQKLQELGLGDCVVGIDSRECEGYVVYKEVEKTKDDGDAHAAKGIRHEHIPIAYPPWENAADPNFGGVSKELLKPAAGRSFHHGRFVMRLREAARKHANVTIVEGTVQELIEEGDVVLGVTYKTKQDGQETNVRVHAPLTIDCTGSFSRLRKRLSTAKPTFSSHFVALLMRNVKLPYNRYAYVVMARPAPVLCYEIATGEVRVLVGVEDPLPSVSKGDLKRYMLETVLPQLPDFFQEPFRVAAEERLRSVPCQILATAAVRRPGALALGDSLNMRHPLTGGGMTVALTDVVLLSKLLRQIPDLSNHGLVLETVKHLYDDRRNTASTINILSQALYDVFCGGSSSPGLAPVQLACFDYFPKYGSHCLGLLSGLNPSPMWLVRHFFTVAGFAIYRCTSPWQFAGALYSASAVIVPLLLRDLVFTDHHKFSDVQLESTT